MIKNNQIPQVDVLLIEDDQATVRLITHYLHCKGFTCKGVMTGSTALEELRSSIPKIILLDIFLPDISGAELCKRIKGNKKYENIPIYYLTAIPLSEVKKKVAETNANGYISKPFNLANFDLILNML